jgi:putative endonuclease
VRQLKLLARLFSPRPRAERADHLETGDWGEREAEKLLKSKGCRILGRNLRVGRRDEIDIVARDGEHLVFVEVKTRKNTDFGSPASAVDRRKKYALSRAAVRYIKRLRAPPVYVRFDVVEVVGTVHEGVKSIRHLPNAFPLASSFRLPQRDQSGK